MPDETNELSPDLEWMLQGMQASTYLVLEALLQEYSGVILRLTQALLVDNAFAEQAAVDACGSVIASRDRYYGGQRIDLFILSHTVAACSRIARQTEPPNRLAIRSHTNPTGVTAIEIKASEDHQRLWIIVDDLPDSLRTAILLEALYDLTAVEIGLVLKISEKQITQRLIAAKEQVFNRMDREMYSGWAIDQFLKESLRKRWPPVQASDQSRDRFVNPVLVQLDKAKRNRRMMTRISQGLLASIGIAFILFISWMTNNITFRVSPNAVAIHTVLVTKIVRQKVFVTATPLPEQEPAALTAYSTQDEIRQRILESRNLWTSMWAEAQIYQYGPAGYVGPPVVRREQMWISQPENSLLISGPVNGNVDKIWLSIKGRSYAMDNNGKPFDYDYQQSWIPDYMINSFLIFVPETWAMNGMDLSMAAPVNTVGRDALIVDVKSAEGKQLGRLWVDDQLGVTLGLRIYDTNGFDILTDVFLTKVVYDVDIPEFLYTATSPLNHFVEDYRALRKSTGFVSEELPPAESTGHDALMRIPPPSGLDLTDSYLIIQWSQIPQDHSKKLELVPVDIFADGFFLVELPIVNPWSSVCRRSPDGRILAFVEQPDQPPFPSYRIRWLELENPEITYEPLPVGSRYGNDFAFSPDSHKLAFWGCGVRDDNCGVYILDLTSQKLLKLLAGDYADGFLWSSDGKELAMLRSDGNYIVSNTTSRQIISKQPVGWVNNEFPLDAPFQSLGSDLLPVQSGLQGCATRGD